MKAILCAAAAVSLTAGAAQADSLRLLMQDENTATAIDMDSLYFADPIRTASFFVVLSSPLSETDHIMASYQFDCDRNTMTQLWWTAFNAEGASLENDDTMGSEAYVTPGTGAHGMLDAVCDPSQRPAGRAFRGLPSFREYYRSTVR